RVRGLGEGDPPAGLAEDVKGVVKGLLDVVAGVPVVLGGLPEGCWEGEVYQGRDLPAGDLGGPGQGQVDGQLGSDRLAVRVDPENRVRQVAEPVEGGAPGQSGPVEEGA